MPVNKTSIKAIASRVTAADTKSQPKWLALVKAALEKGQDVKLTLHNCDAGISNDDGDYDPAFAVFKVTNGYFSLFTPGPVTNSNSFLSVGTALKAHELSLEIAMVKGALYIVVTPDPEMARARDLV